MRAEQACRPTAFGVTQNPRLERPASVRWILESHTTEGTCPGAQLRPHLTLLPRADLYQGRLHPRCSGGQRFLQTLPSASVASGCPNHPDTPAGERRSDLPSPANMRQAFSWLSWDRKRLQGLLYTHGWLSFSWVKNLQCVCASWVGLCKLLMPKENH